MEILWTYCEHGVEILWTYCGNIVEILWKYCENFVEILWKYCENIVKILWKCCGNIVEILWKYCGNIVEILCRIYPEDLPTCNSSAVANLPLLIWAKAKYCEKTPKFQNLKSDLTTVAIVTIVIMWGVHHRHHHHHHHNHHLWRKVSIMQRWTYPISSVTRWICLFSRSPKVGFRHWVELVILCLPCC